MKRNTLLTLVCCLSMGVAALIAVPQQALAIPYHATDSELQGTAYAVFNPTTEELDFVRSTELHKNKSVGTVKSISGGSYTGTIYTDFSSSHVEYASGYPAPWGANSKAVRSVRFVDAVRPSFYTSSWFDGMKNCTTMDLSKLDTSRATSMFSMFSDCSSLISLDLSSFDTSKAKYMDFIFDGCPALSSLDLSSFDTSQVTDMQFMFYDCSALASLDVSSFDTSQVTDMSFMFNACTSLTSLDLSNFDTSKVTRMNCMFYGCTSLNKTTFGDKFVIS